MNRALIITSICLIVSGLFSSSTLAQDYKVTEPYSGLRNMVLTTNPEAIGLKPRAGEVWGILMETGYPEAVATLVTLADGTLSIYFSNGGGIIGLGPHPGPEKAGKAFLSLAQQYAKLGEPTERFPLPKPFHTRFYFLTESGTRTAEVNEDDLGNGRHLLSPLFHKGRDLISQIFAVEEQHSAESGNGTGNEVR